LTSVQGPSRFRQVSSTPASACAVGDDERGYCWGWNETGQLGDGTTLASSTPVLVQGDLAFRAISVGGGHACGVTTTDLLYCWGAGFSGQLGGPAPDVCLVHTGKGAIPVPCATRPLLVAPSLRFRSVSAGVSDWYGGHTCAVALDGQGYCWGTNGLGELGQGDTTGRRTPSVVMGSISFDSISAGGAQSCGLSAGRAYCWGGFPDGAGFIAVKSPVPVGPNLTFQSVDAGGTHSCGITATGLGYCWGQNYYGQLGIGGRTATAVPLPVSAQQ
ncbi:MAG: RCC1 domain-containing protein, partial [Gemmatimonadales bacterium]